MSLLTALAARSPSHWLELCNGVLSGATAKKVCVAFVPVFTHPHVACGERAACVGGAREGGRR